jgi:hypothetical protein
VTRSSNGWPRLVPTIQGPLGPFGPFRCFRCFRSFRP